MPEETQDIAVPQTTALDGPKKQIKGMEEFDAEELVVPFIRLIQATSDVKNGNPGQLINSSTNQAFDSLDVVFIGYSKGYVSFEDPKTKEKKPPQREYRLLAIDQKTKYPLIFNVTSITSIGEVKRLLNSFYQASCPMWSEIVRVSGQKRSGKSGIYYALSFENLEENTDEAMVAAEKFYDTHASSILKNMEGEADPHNQEVEDIDV